MLNNHKICLKTLKRQGYVIAAFYQRPPMLCSMFTRLRSRSCITLIWNNSSLMRSHPPTSRSSCLSRRLIASSWRLSLEVVDRCRALTSALSCLTSAFRAASSSASTTKEGSAGRSAGWIPRIGVVLLDCVDRSSSHDIALLRRVLIFSNPRLRVGFLG